MHALTVGTGYTDRIDPAVLKPAEYSSAWRQANMLDADRKDRP